MNWLPELEQKQPARQVIGMFAPKNYAIPCVKLTLEELARMTFRRTRLRVKILRGLGPLMGPLMGSVMGLLALGAPLFSEPLAAWSRCALANASGNTSELRLVSDSSLFLHPLASLLRLAAAGSPSSSRVQGHRHAVLGWDALRCTSLGGSLWMVRDHLPTGRHAPRITSLRC
jgi:hypothetical protein